MLSQGNGTEATYQLLKIFIWVGVCALGRAVIWRLLSCQERGISDWGHRLACACVRAAKCCLSGSPKPSCLTLSTTLVQLSSHPSKSPCIDCSEHRRPTRNWFCMISLHSLGPSHVWINKSNYLPISENRIHIWS